TKRGAVNRANRDRQTHEATAGHEPAEDAVFSPAEARGDPAPVSRIVPRLASAFPPNKNAPLSLQLNPWRKATPHESIVRPMSPLVVSLEAIRTDGWFERVGEGIGSFQALCEIVGSRFFAFAMITGARITSLTVDRRVPDNTLVEFAVGADEEAGVAGEPQRLTLGEVRHRLVTALVIDEPHGPAPKRATDLEAVQLHIGVRYLLLAPLYGYALRELRIGQEGSNMVLLHDGMEETYPLPAFRARIRTHVREELERVRRPAAR